VKKLCSVANEPLDAVLGHYEIEVLDIRNESYKGKKGVWWINTTGGMKILKKISNSEETLKFIMDAIRHLSANGIHLPYVNKTKEGMDYTKVNDTCYVLTDAITGRNPSYSSMDELRLIAGELARFHKASEGFHPAAGTKPKYHLGLWVEDYTEQLEDINMFYKNELRKTEHNQINSVILKEFPHFYERALKAIDGLRGNEYTEWVKYAEKTGCLCHQDFAAGNLLLTPEKQLYVLDTDSLTVDIPARDIRKLINKIMKKAGKWDQSLAKKIFAFYQEKNPLKIFQWQIVKFDLMFPHLFLGAVNKYYYKRDKEWTEEKYMRRIIEMAALEKTAEPILDDFNSIIPA